MANAVFFTATGLPAGAELNAISGEVSFSPGFESAGTYAFTVTASDGLASSSSEFGFTVTQTNRAPILSAIPPVAGFEGSEIVVSIAAFDLDGGTPNVSIPGLPDGAFLDDAGDGLISLRWPTDFGDAGQYDLTVVAADASGLSASTPLSINVSPINQRPVVSPTGGRVAIVGEELNIAIVATDGDNDSLSFVPRNLPAGASLDSASGVFTWTPTSLDLGEFNVVVEISDGTVTQLEVLRIVVSGQPIEPAARVELTPSFPALPGQTVTLQPVGSGIAPIESVSVSVQGTELPLDELGRATFTPTRPGRYEVVATATDVQGTVGTTVSAVLVRDPADVAPPNVDINLPRASTVQSAAPLSINVEDRNLDSWSLTLRNLRGGDALTIATGTTTGSNLDAATIDPANLSDGVYELSLSAVDISGRVATTTQTFQVSSVDNDGVYSLAAIDRALDFGDIQVPLGLQYRSSDVGIDSGLGSGWSWPATNASPITLTDVPEGGDAGALRDGSFLHVIAPDGSNVIYQFSPQRLAGTSGAGSVFVPAWTPFGTTDWTLETDNASLQEADGAFYRVADGLPYQPSLIKLTDVTDQTYQYNGDGELTQITFGASTIDWFGGEAIANNGSRLTIRRNDDGRITSLTGLGDAATRLRYSDAVVDLVKDPTAQGSLTRSTTGALLAGLSDGLDRALFSYTGGSLTQSLTNRAGESVAVSYNDDGSLDQTLPINEFLGGLRDAVASNITGTLAVGESQSVALASTVEELTSGNTGVALVGISVTGSGGLDPAVPIVDGLAGTSPQLRSGFASALFPISDAGGLAATIAAANSTSGDFAVEIFIAGDLDGDGDVDGVDRSNITAQFGLLPGDAGYNPAADVNRDGVIDSVDADLQAINFGFVADLPPVATDATGITLPGVPLDIDLSENATDPEGSPLDFQVVSTTGGTARLLADGRTVRFTPDSPTGGAIEFTASDLLGQSNVAQFTIDVESQAVTSLQITTTDIQIGVGGAASIDVDAVLSDGTTFDLPNTAITFDVSDSIAVVTPTGTIGGIAEGNGLVTATAFGLTAATSLRVGEDTERALFDIFPTNYAIQVGQTRQFFVREQGDDGFPIEQAGDDDTFYVIADPSIGTITDDGLFTAVAAGTTQVTVIREGVSLVAELLVAVPSLGATTIDAAGGLVADDAGNIIVGIGPGTFDDATTISVAPIAQTDFAAVVPDGFQFGTAFELDFGGADPSTGLSLTAPAGPGQSPGDPMFIFRESQFYDSETETFQTMFQLVDSMIVGVDGIARSTSPPNPQINSAGSYATMFGLTTGIGGLLLGASLDATILAARSVFSVVEIDHDSGAPFFVLPGQFGDIFVPIPTGGYSIAYRHIRPDLGFTKTVFGVDYIPGSSRTQTVELDPPARSNDQPIVNATDFGFEDLGGTAAPVLTLRGEGFGTEVDEVRVLFSENTFFPNADSNPPLADGVQILSVTPDEIRVVPPAGFPLAGSYIRVDALRPSIDATAGGDMELMPVFVAGDPTELSLSTNYVSAVANKSTGTVSIIDVFGTGVLSGSNTLPIASYERAVVAQKTLGRKPQNPELGSNLERSTNLVPSLIANIPVGRGVTDVETTKDGLYAYATNTIDGTISVIDLLTLQEVDVDESSNGLQRINPRGFNPDMPTPKTLKPYHLALHPTLPIGFVTDRDSARVGVFKTDGPRAAFFFDIIDLDPANELLRRIGVDGAITGLTDIAVSDNGRYLAINTPGTANWFGNDANRVKGATIIVELGEDFKISLLPGQKPEFQSSKINIIEVGHKPFGVRYVGENRFAVAARGQESVVIVDAKKANVVNRIATRLRVGEGTLQEAGSFLGDREAAAERLFANLFSIDSPEDIVIGPKLSKPVTIDEDGYEIRQLGFVLMNATFNSVTQTTTNPDLGGGGNIGILANPLDADARYIGATERVPYSWPDQIDIGPDGDSLLASFTGSDVVLVYDISMIYAVVAALASFDPQSLIEPTVPFEVLARKVADSAGPEDINSDPFFENSLDFDEELKTYNQAKLRTGNGRILRGSIPTGRLPSGIAPGPRAPADIVGLVAVYTEPDEGNPKLEINYTIYGDTAEPFQINLYESADRTLDVGISPELDDKLVATFFVSDPNELGILDQTINRELEFSLAESLSPFHILHLDATDTNTGERSEDNNNIVFKVRPFRFEAEFDGNDDLKVFGQYIEDVKLVNQFTFTATTNDINVKSVEVIVVKDGGNPDVPADVIDTKILSRNSTRTWQLTLDTASWVDDPDLILRYFNIEDEKVDERFQFDTLKQPDWLKSAGEVEVAYEFNEQTENYLITRLEELKKLEYTFDEAVPGVKGESISLSFGAGIAFAFDLTGQESNQIIGPYYRTNIFGNEQPAPLSANLFVGSDLATNPNAINREYVDLLQDYFESPTTITTLEDRFAGASPLRPQRATTLTDRLEKGKNVVAQRTGSDPIAEAIERASRRDDLLGAFVSDAVYDQKAEFKKALGPPDPTRRESFTDKIGNKYAERKFKNARKAQVNSVNARADELIGAENRQRVRSAQGVIKKFSTDGSKGNGLVNNKAVFSTTPGSSQLGITPLTIKNDLLLDPGGGISLDLTFPGVQVTKTIEKTIAALIVPPIPVPLANADLFLTVRGAVIPKIAYEYTVMPVGGGLFAPKSADVTASLRAELDVSVGIITEVLLGFLGGAEIGLTGKLSGNLLTFPQPAEPQKIPFKLLAYGKGNLPGFGEFDLFEKVLFSAEDVFDVSTYREGDIKVKPPTQQPTTPLLSSGLDRRPSQLRSAPNFAGLPDPATVAGTRIAGQTAGGVLIPASASADTLALLADDDPFEYLGSSRVALTKNVVIPAADNVAAFRFHQVAQAGPSDRVSVQMADNQRIRVQLRGNDNTVIRTITGDGSVEIPLNGISAGSYGLIIITEGETDAEVDVLITGPDTDQADLVADLHPIDDRLFAMQRLGLTYTITNAGATRSRATRARLVASRDSDIDLGDAILGSSQDIPALEPGERYTFVANVPLGDVAGEIVAIGVWVDPYGNSGQLVSDNDQYSHLVEVGLQPDAFEPNDDPQAAVHLMSIRPSEVIDDFNIDRAADDDFHRFYHPGGSGRLIITPDRSDAGLYAQLFGDQVTLLRGSSTISDPDSGTITTVSLDNLPAGEYTLHLFAESATAYSIEMETETSIDEPILVSSGTPQQFTAIPGTTLPFSTRIHNFGTDSGPVTSTVRLYNGAAQIAETTIESASVRGNEQSLISGAIEIPESAVSATLRFELTMETVSNTGEALQFVEESVFFTSAAEDTAELAEQIGGVFDAGTRVGDGTIDGGRISYKGDIDRVVINLGSDPNATSTLSVVGGSAADLHVSLYNFRGEFIDQSTTGDTRSFNLDGVPAGPVTMQIYSLTDFTATMDYQIAYSLPTATGPNLRAVTIDTVENFVSTDSSTVSVRILNVGDQDAPASELAIYASQNEIVDPATDTLITDAVPVPAIAAGEETIVDVPVSLAGSGLGVGRYFFAAVVDSGSTITEASENDNRSPSRGFVIAPADDAAEPNNTLDSMTILAGDSAVFSLENLTLTPEDVDLFAFNLPSIGTADDELRVRFDVSEGFVQSFLFDSDGDLVRVGDTSIDGDDAIESLSLFGLPADNYVIMLATGGATQYSSDYSFELQREFVAATPLRSDTTPRQPIADTSLDTKLGVDVANDMLEAAVTRWDLGEQTPQIDVRIADLPRGYLGEANITAWSDDGLPLAGTITVDVDADGHGWFVDDTPLDDVEFTREYADGDALGRPGESRYDLLTMLMHEVGHIAGFTDSFAGFASLVDIENGVASITTSHGDVILQSDLDHIATGGAPFDLMNASLRSGLRKLPTDVDVEILSLAHAADTSGFTDDQRLALTSGSGFVSISGGEVATVANGPVVGLTNEELNVADPTSDDYGWRTVGDVRIASGVATITETVGLIGDLSQTFVVPDGATSLKFTIGGLNLDVASGPFPSEAFEVSLLSTGEDAVSLLGDLSGLSGGDAILNVQADGTTYTAPGVRVEGLAQSGGVIDLSEAFDVTIGIPSDAAGQTATLFFDLVGFGDANSSAEVSNLLLDSGEVVQTWQNPIDRFDVNDNGDVTGLDALQIINQLAIPTVHDPSDGVLYAIAGDVAPPPYYDVSGDGRISALDALQIVNELAREGVFDRPTWTNPDNRYDVNAVGGVTASDALAIINELAIARVHNPATGRLDKITDDVGPPPYYDVSQDGRISALDALQIVNAMAVESVTEPETVDQIMVELMGDAGAGDGRGI